MDRFMTEALDRHITGAYGEDSVPDDAPMVEQSVEQMRAAGFPVADAPDPAEAEREMAEWHAASEPQRSAERLECGIVDAEAVDHVVADLRAAREPADAAEAHGFTVDRSEHTRRTLLLWAKTLPQILIPARPSPRCGACGDPVRIVGEEPLLSVEHVDGRTDHKATIGGLR